MWASHPQGRLTVRIRDDKRVNRYAFGTSTSHFHVGTDCGVPSCVVSSIDGYDYAVVNVNTFENIDPRELDSALADFDGETTENRWQRGTHNWTPDVTVVFD